MSFCGKVSLFIPALDMKNEHTAPTCNTCLTRAGFLGVVEFSGCAVLLDTLCTHFVTKYVIMIWNFVWRSNR